MASVNRVILLGHLGRDPETRYAQSGVAICNLSLATSRSRTDKASGEKREETEWHRIVLYDRLAEIAGEYLRKGRPVYIEGRLQTRKWTDKEGVERYTTEIVAESLQLLGGRDDGERPADAAATPARSTQRPQARRQPAPTDGGAPFDDDIPFQNPYRGRLSYVV